MLGNYALLKVATLARKTGKVGETQKAGKSLFILCWKSSKNVCCYYLMLLLDTFDAMIGVNCVNFILQNHQNLKMTKQ